MGHPFWVEVLSSLVRAENPPGGQDIMMFNFSPLLITRIRPRYQPQQQVLTGPKSSSRHTDPWLHDDPWKGSKWVPPTAAQMPVQPRSIAGPMEAEFHAHEEQLSKLQEEITKLSQQQGKQAQSVDRRFAEAEHREKQNHHQMQEALTQMQQGWNKTLHQTMSSHMSA